MKIERPIYMQQLIDSKDNGLIKIVTGLRRVGKSYLLKTLFKEYLLAEKVSKSHILIIDLEDRRQKAFCDPDYLLDWVDAQMKDDEQYYIIIDEAHFLTKKTIFHKKCKKICANWKFLLTLWAIY